MLKVDTALLADARQASTAADVIPLVESAIAIEHATIPLYLCAWLTIPEGTNREAARIIRSVFIDEMVHMGLMANLLIALGGEPRFADAAFVPKYPEELPFGIGSGLSITLRKCDLAQIAVFIEVEKPEHPLQIPDVQLLEAIVRQFDTIGVFYGALRDAILRLQPVAFANPRVDRQIVTETRHGDVVAIASAADAVAAIDLIRLQGEGALTPFADGANAAHYYAFEQIARQKVLHQTPAGPVFGPDALPFDATVIVDMEENVKIDTYADGSPQRLAVSAFAAQYSDMLRKLEAGFTVDRTQFDAALDAMRELIVAGRAVLALDSPTAAGKKAGLVFSYVP